MTEIRSLIPERSPIPSPTFWLGFLTTCGVATLGGVALGYALLLLTKVMM